MGYGSVIKTAVVIYVVLDLRRQFGGRFHYSNHYITNLYGIKNEEMIWDIQRRIEHPENFPDL